MVFPLTMQVNTLTFWSNQYDGLMQTGRPSKQPRTAFGERLHAAREALGLSQNQVAEKMGVNQASYGAWERYPVALRPDQIEQLAKILGVTVEHLFGQATTKFHRGGPAGKMRQIFEAASRLSRSQQQHIVRVIEPFIREHANGHKQAA